MLKCISGKHYSFQRKSGARDTGKPIAVQIFEVSIHVMASYPFYEKMHVKGQEIMKDEK